MSRARGYTLVELVVVILVAGIAASLVLPAALRARRNARITECSKRLSAMGKLAQDYQAKNGSYPSETGPAFWQKLNPDPAQLTCPVKGGRPANGCDYRGPAGAVARYSAESIIGADGVTVHSGGGESVGGNVLRKGGEVQTVHPADGLWEQAERQTQ